MKKLLLVCLLLAWSGTAASAQPSVRLYGFVGPSSPLAPNAFSDFWNVGYTAGAAVGVHLIGAFEVVGGVSYHLFPIEEDEFLGEAGVLGIDLALDGGAISVLSGTVRLKANLEASKRFAPYAFVGVGVHRRRLDDFTISVRGGDSVTFEGDAETTIGFEAGLGVGLILTPRVQFYAEPSVTVLATELSKRDFELNLNLAKSDNTRFLPVRFGVLLDL